MLVISIPFSDLVNDIFQIFRSDLVNVYTLQIFYSNLVNVLIHFKISKNKGGVFVVIPTNIIYVFFLNSSRCSLDS